VYTEYEAIETNAERKPAPDLVNHPPHYTHSGIEAIAVIDAWGLGFCLGNVVKYIARAEHKGTQLQDLKKARWYLDHEIQRLGAVAPAPAPAPAPEVETCDWRFRGAIGDRCGLTSDHEVHEEGSSNFNHRFYIAPSKVEP
jgi:hypothetical protein